MISIFLNRIYRSIKIDADLFDEVQKDKSATIQAGVVVLIAKFSCWCGFHTSWCKQFSLRPYFIS